MWCDRACRARPTAAGGYLPVPGHGDTGRGQVMHARQDHQAGTGQRGAAPARWRGAIAAAATVIATAALALTAGAVPASAAGGYTVTATIPVGSGPQGVAVDPAAGSVYLANYSSDSASVIDEATNTVTATI